MTRNAVVNVLRETNKPMTVTDLMVHGFLKPTIIALLWLGEVEGVLERYGMGGDTGSEMMWRAK